MRGALFAAACVFVATACAHQTREQPVVYPPFLAAAAAAPAPLAPPDRDPDGVPVLSFDLCPDELDRSGGLTGCSDSDAVHAGDRCPDLPENFNDFEDDDGCPDADPPHVARLLGLAAAIQFTPSKKSLDVALTLTDAAARALGDVVDILQAHPHLHLTISVHTALGDDLEFARVGLSYARAARIFSHLVALGVDPQRLQTAGYGASVPLVAGTSRRALARNRRVEFSLHPPPAAVVLPDLQ